MYATFKENALNWFFLISLLLITGWILYNLQVNSPIITETVQSPNYALKDFVTVQMNEQGQLRSQLSAKSLIHYKQAATKLEAPTVVFFRAGQRIWTIQAEQGEMSPDGKEIRLLGQTLLQRESDVPEKQMTIKTCNLSIQRDKQYAETNELTTILSNNTETQSKGVRVFMPIRQVELVSQVRGQYQQNKE